MLVPWVAAVMLIPGLITAGAATAKITQAAGTHRAPVHMINLHNAYEAGLGHATVSQPAGIIYAQGQGPSITGRGGNECTEPNCPVYYWGGQVQQNPHVYLLLWGPDWSSDPSQKATADYLESFYSGLGVEPQDDWSTITSQYGDSANQFPTFGNSVYEGVYNDTNPPPSGATLSDFATEADTFASKHDITDLSDAQIVIATQSGTCPAGFVTSSICPNQGPEGDECSYHAYSKEPFTNLPYLLDAGSACGEDSVNANGTYDGFSIVGGHEYADTITDPQPFNGWADTTIPNETTEIADKCTWSPQSSDVTLSTETGTESFAMQPLWSNQANGCVMSRIQGGDITMDNPGTQSDYQWVKQISLQMIGTSSYGYELTWSASGLPAGLTINPSDGLISGQVQGNPGTYPVTVTASDPTVTTPPTVNFDWIVSADVGSTVKNKGSGLCLNDSKWTTTPGNEVFLWHCDKIGNEKFSHPANTDELIVFGQCLTDPHSTRGAGQLLEIFPCASPTTTDQEWYYNSKKEYILQANNLCLTDPADATQNGTPVTVDKCTDAKDQQWLGR